MRDMGDCVGRGEARPTVAGQAAASASEGEGDSGRRGLGSRGKPLEGEFSVMKHYHSGHQLHVHDGDPLKLCDRLWDFSITAQTHLDFVRSQASPDCGPKPGAKCLIGTPSPPQRTSDSKRADSQ